MNYKRLQGTTKDYKEGLQGTTRNYKGSGSGIRGGRIRGFRGSLWFNRTL